MMTSETIASPAPRARPGRGAVATACRGAQDGEARSVPARGPGRPPGGAARPQHEARLAAELAAGAARRARAAAGHPAAARRPVRAARAARGGAVPARVPAGRVGGDWYITAEMPSGQVLIAIGDVAGHGLAAAAGMARLRGALAGLAITGAPPDRLVGWLNDLVRHVGPEHTASVVAGYFDPATRKLTWAQAGHPPPVLVRGGGRRTLRPARGHPARRGHGGYAATSLQLEPATCCCSTATGWSSGGTGRWTTAWPRWPPPSRGSGDPERVSRRPRRAALGGPGGRHLPGGLQVLA